MTEVIAILQGVSPFIAIVFLGVLFLQGRNKEADARLREADARLEAARIEAEAIKVRAQTELEAAKLHAQDAAAAREREAQLARELAESRTQQAETNKQAAVIQAQNIVALATISNAQKQATQAVMKSEKRVIASGIASTESLSDALKEVLIGIVKITSGQVGQTNAIESLQAAVMELVESLNATPGGAAVVEAIEQAVKYEPHDLPRTGTEG